MKSIAYVIAVLAAVGIVVALSVPQTADQPGAGASADVTPAAMTEAGQLVMEVPSMHCQFACYPKIKKTLEGTGTVTEVALADQPDPGALTVKRVVVNYDAGFDVQAAIRSLEAKGFGDAVVVQ